MALLDRAIQGADTLVLYSESLKNHCNGAGVTLNATLIDPMVSGSEYALLFDGTAGSKGISVPIKNLSSYKRFSLETHINFTGAFTQYTIATLGSTEFIRFIVNGLLRVTIPYNGITINTFIPYTPETTTQIVLNMTETTYSVWVNGAEEISGSVDTPYSFIDASTFSMTSPNPAAGTLVFGALAVYPEPQSSASIQARLLEAVSFGPDADAEYNFTSLEISDFSQDFSVKFDVPKSYDWAEFLVEGTREFDDMLQLDLKVVEEYKPDLSSYFVPDLSEMTGAYNGMAYAYLPYITASTNRGIVHLYSKYPGRDQYALRFNASNRIDFLHTRFSTDVDGVDNSVTTVTQLATPSVAIPNGSNISVGFGWDGGTLYAIYGTTVTNLGITDFTPYGYQAMFGNARTNPNGNFDQPYFASQSAWTWQIRMNALFNPLSVATGVTNYGTHSFFTADVVNPSVPLPVRGEATVYIDVTLPPGEIIRTPYVYVDGQILGTLGETVI